MALTLAEQFKETAGKDFPEWQAYEEMRVERDLAAKPVLKIDLNNLEDLSDAELDKNPELLAIKRARERQAAALADELDEIIKERREKEEITARRNDLLEETMDISGRMQQWDNEISDFGNLGLTNKEVMDRLSFFKKNKEEIIQNLIDTRHMIKFK